MNCLGCFFVGGILEIEKVGSKEWKKQSRYHRRTKAEVAMFRFKTIFGPKTYLRACENLNFL